MADPRGKMFRPAPVANLLESVFRGTPTEKRLREGKIWLIWDGVVGEQIAARARPVRFSGGVLTVLVVTPPWMQQLNFLKKALMEKLNGALGEPLVTEIFLKAGKPDLPPAPEPDFLPQRQPLSPEEQDRIDRETALVADPELRSAFAQLLAKHRNG